MTPQERARQLTQDIIDNHIEQTGPYTTAPTLTRILSDHLAFIPRTHIPPVKYDEADQGYEHTLGSCHESFGSAAAMDIAAEWLAIAEHMAEREAAAQHAQDVADLAAALEYGDADLTGMDS